MAVPLEIVSRARRAKEGGWMGRRRWYRCRKCDKHFMVDTGKPLPEEDRLCPECRGNIQIHEGVKGAGLTVNVSYFTLRALACPLAEYPLLCQKKNCSGCPTREQAIIKAREEIGGNE